MRGFYIGSHDDRELWDMTEIGAADMSREGERDLGRLLSGLSPRLDPQAFVFVTCGTRDLADLASDLGALKPFAMLCEDEGITLVVPLEAARRAGFDTGPQQRRIVLEVHSSLEAVGLTAAVSTALAEKGMPANVLAGYFHDHLFVSEDKASQALDILRGLAAKA